MTALGLVVMACALTQTREIMDFFALTPESQGLWIEHATNLVTRAYEPVAGPKSRASDPAASMAAMERFKAAHGGG